MGILLEAVKTFPYAGRTIRCGQTFHAKSPKDVHLLTLTKIAKIVPTRRAAPPPVDDVVTVRVEMADDEAPKRRYRRRDVTADPE